MKTTDNKKLPLKIRFFNTAKKWLMVILNPRLLLCLFVAWMITNGWSYVVTAIGTLCEIQWMIALGTAYMSLLWVPFTPEKLLTVIIALFLMRVVFPRDEKTIGVLREQVRAIKESYIKKREQRRQRRYERRNRYKQDLA